MNCETSPGLSWLVDRMRLIKAGVLRADREQTVMVVGQLVGKYGEGGAKELYQASLQAMRDIGGWEGRSWPFESLLGSETDALAP